MFKKIFKIISSLIIILLILVILFVLFEDSKIIKDFKKTSSEISEQNSFFDIVSDKEKILNNLRKEGLSENSLSEISKNIRVGIYFKVEDTDFVSWSLPIGITKIGGKPDLPKDYKWPKNDTQSLTFLAQINLEEIKKYDKDDIFPKTGMIYFFYNSVGERPQGECAKNNHKEWEVYYFNGDMSLLKRRNFPNDVIEKFPQKEIKEFVSFYQLPWIVECKYDNSCICFSDYVNSSFKKDIKKIEPYNLDDFKMSSSEYSVYNNFYGDIIGGFYKNVYNETNESQNYQLLGFSEDVNLN